MELKLRLEKVFKAVFLEKLNNRDFNEIDQNSLEDWDSLNHLNLIMALEEEFHVDIEPEDMAELNSFNKIMEYLKLSII